MPLIGKKLFHYPVLDSTNDEARRLIAQGEGEGLVVTAASQTKGRGKPGARWISPVGNLFLSAVINPYKNPTKLAPLTLVAALASRAMIAKLTKLPVVIKWPNDLLLHGKKVGGILTERLAAGPLIIGIGINLNVAPAAFTSLKKETGRNFAVGRAQRLLIAELEREYLAYLTKVC